MADTVHIPILRAIKEYGAVATGQIAATSYDLHGYQQDFLQTMAASQGLATPAAALERIVGQAMTDAKIQAAIFDEFHCIHCGSVNPAEWIATRKGDKKPMTLPLSAAAASFLEQPMLVKVERLGEPPKKQVVPGAPKHADASKAVRCCVDWCDTCDQCNQNLYSFPPLAPFLFLPCLILPA